MVFFLVLINYRAYADVKIKSPGFSLTGIETKIKVVNVSDIVSAPFQYKLIKDGKTIVSGLSAPSKDIDLNIILRDSGINNFLLFIGSEGIPFSIRAIPGWCSVVPPILAIISIIFTRHILLSLLLGAFVGSFFIYGYNPLSGFCNLLGEYLPNTLANSAHSIGLVTFVLTAALFGILKYFISNSDLKLGKCGPVTYQIFLWFSCLFAHFEYLTGLLTAGSLSKLVNKESPISKEKFAYILHSSIVTISSLSVLSTWFLVEMTLIKESLANLNFAFEDTFVLFGQTIPFRFYSLLTIFFILFSSITKKDFGPMLSAERLNASRSSSQNFEDENKSKPQKHINLICIILPIIIISLGMLIALPTDGGFFSEHLKLSKITSFPTGNSIKYTVIKSSPSNGTILVSSDQNSYLRLHYDSSINDGMKEVSSSKIMRELKAKDIFYGETTPSTLTFTERLRASFASGNSVRALLWCVSLALAAAIVLGKYLKIFNIDTAISASIEGIKQVIKPIMLLIPLWLLNDICYDLGTGSYISGLMGGMIPYWLLPTVVFIIAMIITFLTGSPLVSITSVLPIAAFIAYQLNKVHFESEIAMISNAPDMLVYLKNMIIINMTSGIEGAVFGLLCSPASQSSILTSSLCSIKHKRHIGTQAPYAALIGLITIIFCLIPAGLGLPPYLLLAISIMVIATFIAAFGKKVDLQSSPNKGLTINK